MYEETAAKQSAVLIKRGNMRFGNLLLSALTSCVLVGASGAAMAAEDCNELNPQLQGDVVVGTVRVTADCVISSSIIYGNVVADLDANETLVLSNSIIVGRVKVVGGAAVVFGNTVAGGNNIVIDSVDADTSVTENLVQGSSRSKGNILVRNLSETAAVLVSNNTVSDGDIRCAAGGQQTGGDVFATGNLVPRGTVNCFGQ